jgi:hypothetical protein
MAAPVDTYIQTPDDSANTTGKKVWTQSRVVGGQTVHAHRTIRTTARKLLGLYSFASALQSVSAGAQNPTTNAFLWLFNTGATHHLRLRALRLSISCITETDMATTPRIAAARFTFSGTPAGGTAIVPALRKSDDEATGYDTRASGLSGATVTLAELFWGTLIPAYTLTTSGIGWASAAPDWWEPQDEDEFMDLAPGEGVTVYQPDAGTTSDGRRLVLSGRFDKYDAA